MAVRSPDGVVCRQCGGANQADSRYCWHCGASLRGWIRRPRKNREVGWAGRVVKWVLAVAVALGVLYGIYYAVDLYLLPLFRDDDVQAEVVTTVAAPTTTAVATSTTSTTIPRQDTLVAGGKDRYETAIVMSELGFPSGAPVVVLAGGSEYADAIPAVPLAAAYRGPVLLIPPEGVRDDIGAEIQRLAPSAVFLVGVPGASNVRRQLEDILGEPSLTTLDGDDPYETAALVAAELKGKLGVLSKVVIVPSDSFVEALTVAPLAAAKGWPILLAPPDAVLRESTTDAMTELQVVSALMAGTYAKVSLDQVERLVGADSYETAALITQYALNQGSSFAHAAITTGESFPDGLVTAGYVARDGGVLLPAKNGQLAPALQSLLKANLDSVRRLDFIALPQLKKEVKGWGDGTG